MAKGARNPYLGQISQSGEQKLTTPLQKTDGRRAARIHNGKDLRTGKRGK
jgi:hypothetical protein